MMNDNISIKKLWYDEDFYEVQIIMSMEQIRCKVTSSPTCRGVGFPSSASLVLVR